MNLPPQYWTRLADIPAVCESHLKRRSARPIDATGAVGGLASDGDSMPTMTTAPLALTRSIGARLAVLLPLIALTAGWLLARDAVHDLRGLLLGASVAIALLLPITLHYVRHTDAYAAEAAAGRRQVADMLGCLREGLFSIGRDLRLQAPCSESLSGSCCA